MLDMEWNLSSFPGYENYSKIDELDVRALDSNRFLKEYWETNKPLIIKNGIKHWPAIEKWKDIAYLKSRLSDTDITVRNQPWIQDGEYNVDTIPKTLKKNTARNQTIRLHDFFARLASSSDQAPIWQIPAAVKTPVQANYKFDDIVKRRNITKQYLLDIESLAADDVLGLSFVERLKKPRMYSHLRFLFYQNSFAEWHAHPFDTHFLCQIKGRKEVLLMAPNEGFNFLNPILDKHEFSYMADLKSGFGEHNYKTYRVVLDEGDVLHIPIYWYHAVHPTDKKFGISCIKTYANPTYVSGNKEFLLTQDMLKNGPKNYRWFLYFARLSSFFWKHKCVAVV